MAGPQLAGAVPFGGHGADPVLRYVPFRLDLQECKTALNSKGSCSRGMFTNFPETKDCGFQLCFSQYSW